MRIRTRSRSSNGFRRCGVRHTPEPQVFPEGQFTAEEVERLLDDPELVVDVLKDGETPDDGAPAAETAPATADTAAAETEDPVPRRTGGKANK